MAIVVLHPRWSCQEKNIWDPMKLRWKKNLTPGASLRRCYQGELEQPCTSESVCAHPEGALWAVLCFILTCLTVAEAKSRAGNFQWQRGAAFHLATWENLPPLKRIVHLALFHFISGKFWIFSEFHLTVDAGLRYLLRS